jgi:DNA-binding Lrp family transcriptional regulator
MLETLDDVDRKILQILGTGANSYEEIAQLCNVTRNTVYRRVASLENRGVIKNTISCIINLDKIDIIPVIIGAKIPELHRDKILNLLAINRNIRFLWKTWGDHNLSMVAFCSKGEEGEIIHNIKGILEETGASNICVSVGFEWEKMEYSPFEETEMEHTIAQIVQKRH